MSSFFDQIDNYQIFNEIDFDQKNYLCPHYEKCLNKHAKIDSRHWTCKSCKFKNDKIELIDHIKEDNLVYYWCLLNAIFFVDHDLYRENFSCYQPKLASL